MSEELKILQVIENYGKIDAEYKLLDKEKKALNKKLKAYMQSEEINSLEGRGYVLSYNEQVRTKIKEDEMVQKLKDLGLHQAIKVKEIPDEEMIEKLIYTGEIYPQDLDSCIERKVVPVLKIKKGSED
jgi:hypothetical protein